MYCKIFVTQYNIGFHKPLKDMCDFCSKYKNSNDTEKEEMREELENHLLNKDAADKHKQVDKDKAMRSDNPDFLAACFDLEQVLITPKGFEQSLYYKRRLNTYNLTVYNLGDKNGYSYIWHEGIAQRGGCEIASCIYSFLKTASESNKKNIILYSDNCCGQNKNRFYISMLWYSLHKFNFDSIQHKYLEKGHSFNENDSVHSAIEHNSREVAVYTTPQWAQQVRTARLSQPYIVKEMGLGDFYDFAEVCSQFKNFDLDEDRQKVYWSGVRAFKISACSPTLIEFQYNFDGPVHKLDLMQRRKSREDSQMPSVLPLSCLRSDYPKISKQKYEDLLSLCIDKTIPSVHHAFFVMLSHE